MLHRGIFSWGGGDVSIFPQNPLISDTNEIIKNCYWVQSLNKDNKSKHQYEHEKLKLTFFSFLLC